MTNYDFKPGQTQLTVMQKQAILDFIKNNVQTTLTETDKITTTGISVWLNDTYVLLLQAAQPFKSTISVDAMRKEGFPISKINTTDNATTGGNRNYLNTVAIYITDDSINDFNSNTDDSELTPNDSHQSSGNHHPILNTELKQAMISNDRFGYIVSLINTSGLAKMVIDKGIIEKKELETNEIMKSLIITGVQKFTIKDISLVQNIEIDDIHITNNCNLILQLLDIDVNRIKAISNMLKNMDTLMIEII